MSAKSASTEKPQAATAVYSDEAWEKLELQRMAMKENRIGQLFDEMSGYHLNITGIERKLIAAVGDPEKANEKLLLLAVRKAGKEGILLSDARRYVRDPNDLNAARERLLAPKDEAGNPTPPLIYEKRSKNNELRIYAVEQEDAPEEEKAE
ncbi:MAG: hypothetical protein ABMA13_05580 [Chthoniobacteraceae bacterium]